MSIGKFHLNHRTFAAINELLAGCVPTGLGSICRFNLNGLAFNIAHTRSRLKEGQSISLKYLFGRVQPSFNCLAVGLR